VILLELLADLAEFRLVDVDFGEGFEGNQEVEGRLDVRPRRRRRGDVDASLQPVVVERSGRERSEAAVEERDAVADGDLGDLIVVRPLHQHSASARPAGTGKNSSPTRASRADPSTVYSRLWWCGGTPASKG